jgi:serine/threonine protein phosphatase PrpC
LKSLRFQSVALSDTGTVRTSNEDAWLVSADGRLLAVADGMGGHRAGEVAAALCIELLDELFEDAEGPRPCGASGAPA